MKKVLIIGCGYGGIVSAWRLAGFRRNLEVTVIDRGKFFNFLPLLPDCLGRMLPEHMVSYPIAELSPKYGFNFVNEEVKSVDLAGKSVFTSSCKLDYDYLIIASGSQTNFYGNESMEKYAYKLDDSFDAKKIREALGSAGFDSYIIAGGGYTGIETATNLRLYLDRISKNNRIIIIERSPGILGPLPEWMKRYISRNLRRLRIDVFTNSVIERIEGRQVYVSGKGEFTNSMLIWAAGVRTADFIQDLDVAKNAQGRIRVDEFLRLDDSCFVIGDASYFTYKNSPLRMAVQFSISQGRIASSNILNSIKGYKLRKYKPFDLGYLVPMANNLSCGVVLGVNVKGLLATACHYIMSLYRTYGLKNKLGIIRALLSGGAYA